MAVTRIKVALYIISAVLAIIGIPMLLVMIRSEERRVGKEC